MENIPKKLFERDIDSINCGLSDIYLIEEDQIEKGQAGFRYNGLTGEKITEWIGDDFYVIGIDSCCGDPIIADFSKEELPIYYMFHDDWDTLQLISDNFEQFIKILHMIDDTDISDESQKDDLISEIEEIVPEEGLDYWQALIQTGYEFLNDID